ncbi:hypothetical protein ACA910_007534 [Epithemia clementina (nom. ined.)]
MINSFIHMRPLVARRLVVTGAQARSPQACCTTVFTQDKKRYAHLLTSLESAAAPCNEAQILFAVTAAPFTRTQSWNAVSRFYTGRGELSFHNKRQLFYQAGITGSLNYDGNCNRQCMELMPYLPLVLQQLLVRYSDIIPCIELMSYLPPGMQHLLVLGSISSED